MRPPLYVKATIRIRHLACVPIQGPQSSPFLFKDLQNVIF